MTSQQRSGLILFCLVLIAGLSCLLLAILGLI